MALNMKQDGLHQSTIVSPHGKQEKFEAFVTAETLIVYILEVKSELVV